MRRKLISGANELQLETKEFTVRDSAFNLTPEALHEGAPGVVKRGRLSAFSRSAQVKDEGAVVNRYVAGQPPEKPKSDRIKAGEHHSRGYLAVPGSQIATAEEKVSIPERS
jgi:hypothetical protein